MKTVITVSVVLFLSGCSSLRVSTLGEAPTIDATLVTIIDNRTAEQKESRRDSVLAPLSVLGEEDIQPSALLFLQEALQKNRSATSQLTLEVNEFYVIDFFPKRLTAATHSGGWLTDAVSEKIIRSKTDWSFVNSTGVPTDGDSIVCLFAGMVNGQSVRVAAFSQYLTSPMAVSIRNDKAFTNAVKIAIEKTAKEILSNVHN